MAAPAAGAAEVDAVHLTFRNLPPPFGGDTVVDFPPDLLLNNMINRVWYRAFHRSPPPGAYMVARSTLFGGSGASVNVLISNAGKLKTWLDQRFGGSAVLEIAVLQSSSNDEKALAAPAAKRPRVSEEADDAGRAKAGAAGAGKGNASTPGKAAATVAAPTASATAPTATPPAAAAAKTRAKPAGGRATGASAPHAMAPLPSDEAEPPAAPQQPAGAVVPAAPPALHVGLVAPGAGPSAPVAVVKHAVTGEVFASLAEALAAAQPDDVFVGSGTVYISDALLVSCPGVTLRGESADKPLVVCICEQARDHTLVVAANDFTMQFVDLHGIKDGSANKAVLVVQDNVDNFRAQRCLVQGAGELVDVEEEQDGQLVSVEVGNQGIHLCNGVSNALLDDVTVRTTSGTGLFVGCRTTATVHRLRAENCECSAVWLRGSGACRFVECVALECGGCAAFYIDALCKVVLIDCAAERSEEAAIFFDFSAALFYHPEELLTARQRSELCHLAHDASRFRAIDNGTFGVVIKAGVSADLTDAELLRNNWSGLRVEGDTLPGATARITLMGATVEGNGVDRQVDANDAERERCGVVLERNAATGVARKVHGRESALVQGNADGDWAEL